MMTTNGGAGGRQRSRYRPLQPRARPAQPEPVRAVSVTQSGSPQPASNAILVVLGGAGLATLAYIYAIGAIAPDLALVGPLLAVFTAAAVSSVAGFAFAPICAAMLVHLIDDPLRMVSMILIASITVQAFVVLSLWQEMDWAGALVVLTGGLCTLPIGLVLLLGMTGRAPVLLLGALLVVYALWMLRRPYAAKEVERPRWADVMIGAAGGITGGFAGFPAGPLVAWFGWCGVGRVASRGIVQPFILMMQLAALLMLNAFAPTRVAVAGVDPTLLLVAAPALSGTICGLKVCGRLSDRVFARAVNLTLLCAGLAMLA